MSVQKPIRITLIDSQPIVDACYQQEFCFSYDWSLQISKSGADGNPLVSIEISEDAVNWDSIHSCAVDVLLDEDSITFMHDILPSKYFRVCVKANGTTTGNISALMYLKRK
jgi:hypothetical protein